MSSLDEQILNEFGINKTNFTPIKTKMLPGEWISEILNNTITLNDIKYNHMSYDKFNNTFTLHFDDEKTIKLFIDGFVTLLPKFINKKINSNNEHPKSYNRIITYTTEIKNNILIIRY